MDKLTFDPLSYYAYLQMSTFDYSLSDMFYASHFQNQKNREITDSLQLKKDNRRFSGSKIAKLSVVYYCLGSDKCQKQILVLLAERNNTFVLIKSQFSGVTSEPNWKAHFIRPTNQQKFGTRPSIVFHRGLSIADSI